MNGTAKLVRVSWMAVALLPLLAGLAIAVNSASPQTNQPNQQDRQIATTPGQTGEFHPKLERAKDLMGAKILSERDEELGTVHDIVLTPNRDAISYVVLSHGGVLGIGDKYFAVPWSQFSLRPAAADADEDKENILVLGKVSKSDLEQAPGIDKENWPATASANWLGAGRSTVRSPDIHRDVDNERYSDETPSDEAVSRAPDEGTTTTPETPEYREPVATEPRMDREESAPAVTPGREMAAAPDRLKIEHRRLSKLLGITIRNPQDEDLGKLNNVVIDVQQGKVAYGVLAMRSGFLGLNKDLVVVPWPSLDFISQAGIARLNVDKETLTALAFDEDNFPNLEDMQYSRQLHQRFNATPYWEALGFIPGEAEHRDYPAGKEGAGHYGMSHPSGAKTFQGVVENVGTYRLPGTPAGGPALDGVSLRLRTDEGKVMTVHVGPRNYLDRQNIAFKSGDQVTVMGSLQRIAGGDVIVASQIRTADKTLDLRTKEGKPLWEAGGMAGSQSERPSTSPSSPDL